MELEANSALQRCRVHAGGTETSPDLAVPSCLPSHGSLIAASVLGSARASSMAAKPQLPFVCLNQETIPFYFEGILLAEPLFAQLKISEEANPEDN